MKEVQGLKLTTPVAISQKTYADKVKQDLKKFDNNYAVFLSSILPPDRSEHFYLVVLFNHAVKANYAIAVKYEIYSKDQGPVVFRNDAIFICPGTSDQDWVSWWVANDGQRLRVAYTKGIQALAELITFDLGVRNALDDNIIVARTGTGTLVARCPDDWWK
jgi:glycosyltransferase involved in cell wall biosynthesis